MTKIVTLKSDVFAIFNFTNCQNCLIFSLEMCFDVILDLQYETSKVKILNCECKYDTFCVMGQNIFRRNEMLA